jgi:regulator of sigma E protease
MGIMQPTPIIDKVMPNSPAAKAGLIPHDKILAINNHPINDLDKDFVQIVNQATGKTINITILRQNQQHIINIIPKDLNNSKIGRIGISFNGEITKYNIPLSCVYSFKTTLLNIKFVFQSFKMLINHQVGLKDMAGPIGIVQIASSQLQKGFIYFLNIMAVISISLGIVNLLPFPALDGGHLLFLLIEFILRKPLNPKILTYINQISMAILITLMVLIIFNDIINWGTRVSLLNKL